MEKKYSIKSRKTIINDDYSAFHLLSHFSKIDFLNSLLKRNV